MFSKYHEKPERAGKGKIWEKLKNLELGNQGKYWLIIGWDDEKLEREDV